MICRNCGFTRNQHLGSDLLCSGQKGTFNLRIDNMSATFLYRNAQGVGESRDAKLFQNGRALARVDNIIQALLSEGNTDISININVEN